MRLLLAGFLLSSALVAQEQGHAGAPVPPSVHPSRFYSPAVDAGDYVYISGQGPRRPDGSSPATFDAQVRQALDNVKAAVESAGLTMEHVVYTQVYLQDISQYGEMNKVFAEYFTKAPPARAVLGVARVPEPPIQINAVAVRSLADKRAVSPPNYKAEDAASPGILTHDRLFISSMAGADPASGKVPDDPAAQVDLALDRAASFKQLYRTRPTRLQNLPATPLPGASDTALAFLDSVRLSDDPARTPRLGSGSLSHYPRLTSVATLSLCAKSQLSVNLVTSFHPR
jgi:2-iminobutanoate/2-iminopropanoate deaminase